MINLNLGCGRMIIPDFVNIDMDPVLNPDMVADVSNLDGIVEDESVDKIVAYDVIEHLDRVQIPITLKNWYRKLKRDGVLYLRTNDWDRLIRLYVMGKFLGHQNPVDFEKLVWHFMCEHEKPGMGHKWGFNKATMEKAILDAGFSLYSFTSEALLTTALYPHADRCDLTNLLVTAVK
ncbi:hypothetical protein CCP3SC15_6690002 [Gammaproteobacteria bacterium]